MVAAEFYCFDNTASMHSAVTHCVRETPMAFRVRFYPEALLAIARRLDAATMAELSRAAEPPCSSIRAEGGCRC